MLQKPFEQSFWVKPGLLCAGQYPGAVSEEEREAKIRGLMACGIRRVVNLMEETEIGWNRKTFIPYAAQLTDAAAARGIAVECLRFPIRDAWVPNHADMKRILDTIDESVQADIPTYVHCWGGHGRTSTVVGCWLVRHGMTGKEAIAQIEDWRASLPKHHYPLEDEQEHFILCWEAGD